MTKIIAPFLALLPAATASPHAKLSRSTMELDEAFSLSYPLAETFQNGNSELGRHQACNRS
jgi:hypothetical protein